MNSLTRREAAWRSTDFGAEPIPSVARRGEFAFALEFARWGGIALSPPSLASSRVGADSGTCGRKTPTYGGISGSTATRDPGSGGRPCVKVGGGVPPGDGIIAQGKKSAREKV
ncbi:hypothetical protein L1987_84575 [Smallanthus sonchifolius]|uniref:Uncharacterized protein n=1 Tax=Smallanthus sonchifolius TaxID=185202 RepID=A0ACB8XVA1_9ASTR|nr:hypothetical protein L1987_84575 [Smallanthus sonchifolius]